MDILAFLFILANNEKVVKILLNKELFMEKVAIAGKTYSVPLYHCTIVPFRFLILMVQEVVENLYILFILYIIL